MTKEEIIEMVMQIGGCDRPKDDSPALRMFETFAKLVAEKAIKEALAQPEQEPVAMRYDFDGYGYQYIDSGTGSDWQTRVQGEPLYTAPQSEQYPQIAINPEIVGYVAPQRKTFNHHEFGYWWFEYGSGLHPLEGEDQEEHSYRVATAAWQAAHGIKGD